MYVLQLFLTVYEYKYERERETLNWEDEEALQVFVGSDSTSLSPTQQKKKKY